MTNSAEIPTTYSHSVKIEQSAYGARVSVHVNANDPVEAMEHAINLYRQTRSELEHNNEIVAPIETKEKK